MSTYPIGYIYAIENTFDTNVYIGSTIKPVEERFRQHVNSAKRTPECVFHKYMALHGCDNFYVTCIETVYNVTICQLQMLERSFIKGYGSLNTVHSKSDVVIPDSVLSKVGQKTKPARVFEYEMPNITLELILEVTKDCYELVPFIELRDMIFDDTNNMSKAMEEMCSSEKSNLVVTKAVLEWLGYDNDQERNRKQTFLKLLKSNDINFRQIKHNDPDFNQYPEFVEEAKTMSDRVLTRQQWIILDAQDFKRVVFSLRTKRSREIVNYYLSLERLMAMYTEYTHHFQIIRERRRADLEKKSLLAMMEGLKLDHQKARQEDKRRYEEDQRRYEAECAAAQKERDAAERGRQVAEQKFNQLMARGDELLKHAEQAEDDRMVMMHDIAAVRHVAAPEPPKSENFHRMAIVKMSPNYEWDEQTDKRYLRHVDAIAVRIQVRDFNARIREIQNYGNGTNKDAEIIISFDSPNPVRLYNKLKPTYSNQFTFVPPVGIRFEPGTEEDLVAAVRDMHEARMQYPHNE